MVKVERKVNKMWQECSKMPAGMQKEISRNAAFIGKWQYSYSAERGKIGMIRISESFPKKTFWEICCLEGKLLNDTERFSTKKEAEKRIKQMLEGKRKLLLDALQCYKYRLFLLDLCDFPKRGDEIKSPPLSSLFLSNLISSFHSLGHRSITTF